MKKRNMNNEIEVLKKFPLQEIEKSFMEIPFGNSDFQIENFIINAQITPERAFRAVCLTLRAKIGALREEYYNQKRRQIDLDELQFKISNPDTNEFDRRRAMVDYEEKLAQVPDTQKLINDALHEVELLYEYWKKLPHPTRSEFESKEVEYYTNNLYRQAVGITGASESLLNMGYALTEKGLEEIKEKKLISETLNPKLLCIS